MQHQKSGVVKCFEKVEFSGVEPMNLDLSMTIVWLFLGLSLGGLGLLMVLTLINTLSAISPTKLKIRRFHPLQWRQLFPSGSSLHLPQFPASEHPIPSEPSEHPTDLYTLGLFPLTCELDIRSATISSSCCLLHTKQGQPLHGGAISTRLTRLKRMGVLI